ncbi:MAG: hypothetical protein ABSE77_07015, partial [Acidimicrobiales bacterium]
AWGYIARRATFPAWAKPVAARSLITNPHPALRWKSDDTRRAIRPTFRVPSLVPAAEIAWISWFSLV